MLHDELAHFAGSIVHGLVPSAQISKTYSHYAADIALDIYRNNYRGNLHDALAGAYPVVRQLVGDDFFRFMSRKFIGQYPSRSANLHHYGAELADFVATFEPAKELAYLPDMAALEWACHQAYFAEDGEVLDLNELAQVPPETYSDLVLLMHPSCHLLHSGYPIAAIWHAHQLGASNDFNVDLNSGSCNALVSRDHDMVTVTELTEVNAVWLQRIQTGAALGEATEETMERYPDFNLLPVLQTLVAQNIFASFTPGANS
ncbi:hypothetical protein GALL_199010 [mine drainage metagenome]|uniref:Putative DNA-binding domain-containing protein n=1 Tax=mine drainage metagenome TaxID=410659 RepID=A0A1J5RR10_9ZZZZ